MRNCSRIQIPALPDPTNGYVASRQTCALRHTSGARISASGIARVDWKNHSENVTNRTARMAIRSRGAGPERPKSIREGKGLRVTKGGVLPGHLNPEGALGRRGP